MTIGTKENARGDNSFVEQLNGAIRENPVSAGLLGLGIAWMFFGSGKIASFSNALPGAARSVADKVGRASASANDAAKDMVGKVGEAMQDAGGSVKRGAEEAVATVASAKDGASRTAGEASRTAGEFGRNIAHSVQGNLTSTFEGQPLLLGMIGVGIGAGIASMFSSTGAEQEFAGAAAKKVKDQVRDIASQAGQRAEQVFDDIKREVADQGLTSATASESFQSVVEKVKSTTTAAKQSILTHPN